MVYILVIILYFFLGMFYFLLGNLHPRHRSSLKSIQLVAICKNTYIKKYGMNIVLQPFIEDMQKLVKFLKSISVVTYIFANMFQYFLGKGSCFSNSW